MAREDFDIVDQKPIGRGAVRHRSSRPPPQRRQDRGAESHPHGGEHGAGTIAAERHGAILQEAFASEYGMVPEVFEYGPDGDDFYIAMELVEGPSLEELLRKGALPYDEAVGHALWLCEFPRSGARVLGNHRATAPIGCCTTISSRRI
jgi:serine/threonine protein kinase